MTVEAPRPATPMARQILEHRSLLQRARALSGEARRGVHGLTPRLSAMVPS